MRMNNEYKHEEVITNMRDYEFWLEFFRTDPSIGKFEQRNESDCGMYVVFKYNYAHEM